MLRDVLWKRTKDIQRCNTTQLLLFSNVQICIPFSLVHKYLNPHRKSPSHNHKYLYFASLPGTFPRLSYMQSIKTRLKIELGFCRGRTGKDHLKEERKKGQMPGGVFLNALQSFFFLSSLVSKETKSRFTNIWSMPMLLGGLFGLSVYVNVRRIYIWGPLSHGSPRADCCNVAYFFLLHMAIIRRGFQFPPEMYVASMWQPSGIPGFENNPTKKSVGKS